MPDRAKRCIAVSLLLLLCSFLVSPFSSTHAHAPEVGTWRQFVYTAPAGSRLYYVYTPVHYQPGVAVPMLVMLHGCSQTAADFALATQMNQIADQHNFIVVYPQENAAACWDWYDASQQQRGSGEPSLLAGITQTVEQNAAQWSIDPRHVYVAGFSAGGAMAVILAANYPDLFAAAGVQAGMEYKAATTPDDILKAMLLGGPEPALQGQLAYNAMGSARHLMPTIVFQGSADTTVYPVNGDQVVQQWMQTDELVNPVSYQATFQYPSTTRSGQVTGGYSYAVRDWQDSSGHSVQEYWTINEMGHAWSGGSPGILFSDPLGPSASEAMYSFFIQQSL